MGASQSNQASPAPTVASTGEVPNRENQYEHISCPTFDDLMRAADILDWIARVTNLHYAFAGSFAATLRGANMQVHDIEIVLEPTATRNNFEWLIRISNHPKIRPLVRVTETNHQIVIIRENKGIAFQCSTLGTNGYPNAFIYPFGSHFHLAQYYGFEPTIQFLHLAHPNGRAVPVLRPRFLIAQRLYRFDPLAVGYEERRNIRDIYEIQTLLYSATRPGEYQFDRCVVARLQHRIIEWIAYAERNFISTTEYEINAWNALGFTLTRETVSKQFHRERN